MRPFVNQDEFNQNKTEKSFSPIGCAKYDIDCYYWKWKNDFVQNYYNKTDKNYGLMRLLAVVHSLKMSHSLIGTYKVAKDCFAHLEKIYLKQ